MDCKRCGDYVRGGTNGADLCPSCQSNDDIKEIAALRGEVERLRFYLWLKHGDSNHILYGDDGEQMCNSCLIDFKRDPIESIVATFEEQAIRRAGEG